MLAAFGIGVVSEMDKKNKSQLKLSDSLNEDANRDVYRLPGIYEIKGALRKKAKVPHKDITIDVEVPLEHVAYNIVLPRVDKKIEGHNQKKAISENIHSIDEAYVDSMAYSPSMKKIGVSSDLMDNPKKLEKEISVGLCAELGHALSINRYGIPANSDLNVIEYYDYLSRLIGEDELKNTKYSFKNEDKLKLIDELYEKANAVKTIVENFFESVGDENKRYYKLTDAIYNFYNSTGENTSFGYLRGNALAEYMYTHFGRDSFEDPKKLFSFDEKGSMIIKPEYADKLSKSENENLQILYKKLDTIYYVKKNMSEMKDNILSKIKSK